MRINHLDYIKKLKEGSYYAEQYWTIDFNHSIIYLIAFLLGKYIFPKYKNTIQTVATQFDVIFKYAESFCAYARQFLSCSGSEKMNDVVKKLIIICEQQNIDIDEETLRAIAQKAYDAMKAGESQASAQLIVQTALDDVKEYEPKHGETKDNDSVVDNNNTEDEDTD